MSPYTKRRISEQRKKELAIKVKNGLNDSLNSTSNYADDKFKVTMESPRAEIQFKAHLVLNDIRSQRMKDLQDKKEDLLAQTVSILQSPTELSRSPTLTNNQKSNVTMSVLHNIPELNPPH